MKISVTFSNKVNKCIEDVDDKRIHATMYPVNATNVYKACIAGLRRQRY
jgi:hypothetical protein